MYAAHMHVREAVHVCCAHACLQCIICSHVLYAHCCACGWQSIAKADTDVDAIEMPLEVEERGSPFDKQRRKVDKDECDADWEETSQGNQKIDNSRELRNLGISHLVFLLLSSILSVVNPFIQGTHCCEHIDRFYVPNFEIIVSYAQVQ